MRFWGAIFCFLALAAGTSARAEEWKLLRECQGGKLYQVGSQRVLLLWGSNYQMGKAHGKLLAAEAKVLKDRILKFCFLTNALGKTAGGFGEMYRRTQPFVPPRYQEEMRGLAEGAGVPLHQIQLANLFPEMFHCSGFAMFGKATRNGQLLHGRVLDYMTYLGIQDCAVTIVQRPDDKHAFVNVGYAGFVGSVTGMNEKQIAVGELGGRGSGQWDGIPMAFLLRKALEESETLTDAVQCFRRTPRTCEYYYVVSDGKRPDARGLYGTPKTFRVFSPGQTAGKELPDAVPDVVAFSGGARLRTLLERIRRGYGSFTPASAIRLMERPVAMESNLHDVLFAPQTLELWVAHAVKPTVSKYQACYQPYRHYRLDAMLRRMPAKIDPAGEEQTGVVPACRHRAMRPETDPALAQKLKRFAFPARDFPWRMTPQPATGDPSAFNVQFPSPWTSPFAAENNTVHCEYYPSRKSGRGPAVIVLNYLAQDFFLSRMLCRYFAACGVHALFIKMPFYGERLSKKTSRQRPPSRLDLLLSMVTQGVMDIRRGAAWLSDRPEVDPDRIGLCGVSLGGFITALTAGVDGQFPRVAIILAGGNLSRLVENPSSETASLRKYIQQRRLSDDDVRRILDPIEPLGFTSRLRDGTRVLMLNASHDHVVPRSCTTKFADACNAKLFWYDANHYTMARYTPLALRQVAQYFSNEDWSRTDNTGLLFSGHKK